jgi:hypothetical protein
MSFNAMRAAALFMTLCFIPHVDISFGTHGPEPPSYSGYVSAILLMRDYVWMPTAELA